VSATDPVTVVADPPASLVLLVVGGKDSAELDADGTACAGVADFDVVGTVTWSAAPSEAPVAG